MNKPMIILSIFSCGEILKFRKMNLAGAGDDPESRSFRKGFVSITTSSAVCTRGRYSGILIPARVIEGSNPFGANNASVSQRLEELV